MKKVLLAVIGICLMSGALHAAPYEIVKEVDDLKIKVVMASDPPAMGDNSMDIVLTDSGGNPVKKAKIKVDYEMPPMGNMPPMMYKTRAAYDGAVYKAKVNLSMSGPWSISLNIKRPEKSIARMMFELKVP